MKKISAAQVLLVIAAFLAPIIGGQISTEATYLAPGAGLLIRSVFSGFDTVVAYIYHGYQPVPAIETPTLSHALVALIVAAAAILVLGKRRVFQVPLMRISIPLVLFLLWTILTIAVSSFTTYSVLSTAEWISYGIAFYVAVAAAGRRRGSLYVIAAIVTGCALVAFKGLFEYGAERQLDPTWRVFSTWANPTSLAGMMTIGMMLSLGLAMYAEDLIAVVPWTFALAMGCCILVTDSRGGVFSMLVGLICLGGFATYWSKSKEQTRSNLLKIGSVFVLALMFGRWVHPVATNSHSNVTVSSHSRYILAGQTTTTAVATASPDQGEQSSGFRFNLWKGAAKLMAGNPVGYGMGTYRFYSAKSGLTTGTVLAHNTYLQIGVEAGMLGLLFFAIFLFTWLYEVVRGSHAPLRPISFLRVGGAMVLGFLLLTILSVFAHVEVFPSRKLQVVALMGVGLVWLYVEAFRKAPNLADKQNMLRAGIVAAVLAMLCDNMLESSMYSYGVGFCAFLLFGVGLVQATDGVAPEFVPKLPRVLASVVSGLAALLVLHSGIVEVYRARARYEITNARTLGVQTPDGHDAAVLATHYVDNAFNALIPSNPIDQIDGDNWMLRASLAASPFERLENQKKAADFQPSIRTLRSVAATNMNLQNFDAAILYCNRALELDPNNLQTLSLLREAYSQNNMPDRAMETARRMIAVEDTPYFQIRSLPQIIPTESYEAHAYVGANAADTRTKISELSKAVEGFYLYYTTTCPVLIAMTKGADASAASTGFGGETMGSAQFKMREGASYAEALAAIYRQQHNAALAYRAHQMAQNMAAFAGPGPA